MTLFGRKFQPKLWAFVVTVLFAAITIRLGNWQSERAEYKISQQSQLEAALAALPLKLSDAATIPNVAMTKRYRSIELTGSFVENELFFLDNRIAEGKAGYGVLQSFLSGAASESAGRTVLVDRGWVVAAPDRAMLPTLETPRGIVTITGRINQPPSRNPGTFDNGSEKRLNYVNLDELSLRIGRKLEPMVVEQTTGPGFTGVVRPPPGSNFERNRGYQLQWYAFAAMAAIIFFVLSFRKQEVA
jgi:surfeit locus 1 family protein